jgi:hypothetical protein
MIDGHSQSWYDGAREKGGVAMASIKEQRAKLQERISALQAREKALAAKEKEKERKARTKRLIEIGAVVESVVGHPIEKEQLEKFKNWLAKRLEKPVETN